MRLVIVESPYAGDVLRNIAYARLACWWLLKQGMAPFASHLLYTQMLDDRIEGERALGMGAGMAWRHGAELTIAFIDYGISGGMKAGMAHARKHEQEVREVMLSKEMGEGKFTDAMIRFERDARKQVVDEPGVLHCGECNAPINTIDHEYRCSPGCSRNGRKMYGESLVARATSEMRTQASKPLSEQPVCTCPKDCKVHGMAPPHEPQIGGA